MFVPNRNPTKPMLTKTFCDQTDSYQCIFLPIRAKQIPTKGVHFLTKQIGRAHV